jgi:hypothetical protein
MNSTVEKKLRTISSNIRYEKGITQDLVESKTQRKPAKTKKDTKTSRFFSLNRKPFGTNSLQLEASPFKLEMKYKCFFCFNQGLLLPLSQRGMRGAQPLIQTVIGGVSGRPDFPSNDRCSPE